MDFKEPINRNNLKVNVKVLLKKKKENRAPVLIGLSHEVTSDTYDKQSAHR